MFCNRRVQEGGGGEGSRGHFPNLTEIFNCSPINFSSCSLVAFVRTAHWWRHIWILNNIMKIFSLFWWINISKMCREGKSSRTHKASIPQLTHNIDSRHCAYPYCFLAAAPIHISSGKMSFILNAYLLIKYILYIPPDVTLL